MRRGVIRQAPSRQEEVEIQPLVWNDYVGDEQGRQLEERTHIDWARWEFKRTRKNIHSIREHAELLTSVRNDISEYKASGSLSPGASLLRERATIHGNVNQLDDVISQAHTTKGALSSQRDVFINIEGKAKHLGDQFPVIRGILGAIKRKKSKDTIILSAVIAACTLFLVVYWLNK
ncbi:hypothetical protein L7F22_044955 [Adiantum nelumboides]|nr:hypothetical protein [Adiantum nelumboides]